MGVWLRTCRRYRGQEPDEPPQNPAPPPTRVLKPSRVHCPPGARCSWSSASSLRCRSPSRLFRPVLCCPCFTARWRRPPPPLPASLLAPSTSRAGTAPPPPSEPWRLPDSEAEEAAAPAPSPHHGCCSGISTRLLSAGARSVLWKPEGSTPEGSPPAPPCRSPPDVQYSDSPIGLNLILALSRILPSFFRISCSMKNLSRTWSSVKLYSS